MKSLISIGDWCVKVSEDRVTFKKMVEPYLPPEVEIIADHSLGFTVKVFCLYLVDDHTLYLKYHWTMCNVRCRHQQNKKDAYIATLNEGIELDQCQKLIADKSEYGWNTVDEYLDNKLASNDQDTKKMKKAEKEAQRKLAKTLTPGHSSLREQWEAQQFRHWKAYSLSYQEITQSVFPVRGWHKK